MSNKGSSRLSENALAEAAIGALALACDDGSDLLLGRRMGATLRSVRGVRAIAFTVAVTAGRRIQLAHELREALLVIAGIVFIVVRSVAGLLGALAFFLVGLEHGALDDLAAGGVDRMS